MKSVRIFSLLAAAAIACAAAASDYVVSTASKAYHFCESWLVAKVEKVVQAFDKPEILVMPKIKFVAAMAYVLRQAKRERPTVTPRWRMCPSA